MTHGIPHLADRLDAIRPQTPDIAAAVALLRGVANRGAFQAQVHKWVCSTFNAEVAADRTERAHRFIEEALELAQATGCTKADASMLLDYVYSRPVGRISQEVGGTMVSLAALCNAHGITIETAAWTEIEQCWQRSDKIRAKWLTKPKGSPLPGIAPAEAAE